MRLLLAEDEASLSKAVVMILKKIITPSMRRMTVWRRWNFWLQMSTMA